MTQKQIQSGGEEIVISAKDIEQILHQCEKELLRMSLVEEQGGRMKDLDFQSPVFRFIWYKLSKKGVSLS